VPEQRVFLVSTSRSRDGIPAAKIGTGLAMLTIIVCGLAWLLSLGSGTSPAAASVQTGTLAFTSLRAGAAQVFAVNGDGSDLRRLTQTPGAAFEGSPAFSSDGRRIAYGCGNFELCIMNADGSSPTRVTTNDWPREFRYDRDPAWSPDGTKLAFTRTSRGRSAIWIVNPDGSGLRQLPTPRGHNANPAFSPDGTRIAFDYVPGSGVTSMGGKRLYVVGVDGGAAQPLTGEDDSAEDPAWSPDGARLVFSRPGFDDAFARLVVVNADGTAERRLATGTLSATNPAWSPDGTTIAFAGRRSGRLLIYSVAAGGGPATRVTSGRATDLDPAWQPSGSPSEVPVPAAPPSKATAEARIAGSVLRTIVELLAELKSDPATSNAGEAATAAGRVRGTARQARSATTKLRVGTARGRQVRRLLLDGMRAADGLAADLSALSRSLRRHDARAARKHRKAIFGDGVGLFFPLSEAAERAGVPHADIAL